MCTKETNSIENITDLVDPQMMLEIAFDNRNIEEFRRALEIGGNPTDFVYKYPTIYWRALSTSGSAEFVNECLKAGCDPYYADSFKDITTIELAITSCDVNILKTLLSFPGVPVSKFLRTSFKTLSNWAMFEHSEIKITETFECLKFILEHEAFINKSDEIEMFLVHLLTKRTAMEPYKLEFVEICLKVPNVNIDADGLGKLRRILEQEFPSLELPVKRKSMKITYFALLNSIKANDMQRFVEQYNDEMRCTNKDEDEELLVESIKSEAHQAFDLLLEKGIDFYEPGIDVIIRDAAIMCGNVYALDKLLKVSKITTEEKETFLYLLIWSTNIKGDEYDKCLDLLLNSVEFDINVHDSSNYTALHAAAEHHKNVAVRKLLKKGASICITNDARELAIERINPTFLEDHLDDCISSNDKKCGDKDYEICIDFKNFVRSSHNNEKQLSEALKPIMFMKESREYRHLLQHPVITSLLYLKWHKLSLIFYINFILFLLFAASIVTFSVLRFRASTNDYEMARVITQYCSWLGVCYLMVREILQFMLSPLNYLFTISNLVEMLLIGCSIVTCSGEIFPISMAWHRNIAVFCILLLAFELVSLAGSLPFKFISTNILILDAVCKSFAKFLAFYSIFILTFSLCFYIKSDTDAEKETTQEAFHKFSNPWAAMLKTIVMFTGEFDADNIKLDSNYMLFLIFVCFMTIILYNLLNGLAVSDTQAIKNQAELNEIICRINILEHYEKTIFGTRQGSFSFICRLFKKLFPAYTIDRLMFIRPNDKNRIRTLKSIERASKRTTKVKVQNLENEHEKDAKITLLDEVDDTDEKINSNRNRLSDWYFSFIKKISSRIDQQTVAQARRILAKKSIPTIDSHLESMDGKLNEMRTVMDGKLNEMRTVMDGKLNEMRTVMEEKLNNVMRNLENIAHKLRD